MAPAQLKNATEATDSFLTSVSLIVDTQHQLQSLRGSALGSPTENNSSVFPFKT